MVDNGTGVAILGGSIGGLAAAHKMNGIDEISEVRVFERQEYETKETYCGESINSSSLVPLEKTPENGFLNDVDGFQIRVYNGTERSAGEGLLAASNLQCEDGYITDRKTVEKQWARSLAEQGVIFETGTTVSPSEYHEIVSEYDYVVDATGHPPLTSRVRDEFPEYSGLTIALNATVTGDFSEYSSRPRLYFENYHGYSWAFPKSPTEANIGIGWPGDHRPDDYMEALERTGERNRFPVPDRKHVNISTIPRGPSIHPKLTHFSEDNVFLVGDAAGISNKYHGEGICQAIRSSYLLGDLLEDGRESEYAVRLFNKMNLEYRLSHLIQGAFIEHRDPQLFADVVTAIEGLTIEEITRKPSRVINRILNDADLTARLMGNGMMISRVVNAGSNSELFLDDEYYESGQTVE